MKIETSSCFPRLGTGRKISLLIAILGTATTTLFSQTPVITVQTGHPWWVTSVAFSPDGKFFLSTGCENTFKLWSVAARREMRSFFGHSAWVNAAVFSRDGRFALSGSGDKTLILWDAAAGKAIRTFRGHADSVAVVDLSPDGRFALSGSADKTLRLWEVGTGKAIRTFSGHGAAVLAVDFSPDGRFALSGSADKTLRLWDVRTGRTVRVFQGHTAEVQAAVFSPDGSLALSGSHDETVRLWDVGTGKERRSMAGNSGWIQSVSFSPDGKYAAAPADSIRGFNILDVETGRIVKSFSGHESHVPALAFSPDGKYVLTGSCGVLKLWDAATGEEASSFSGRLPAVGPVAFSRDGGMLLAAGDDGVIRVWDAGTGALKRSVGPPPDRVLATAFSHDGKFVLFGTSDNTRSRLRLWDCEAGREIKSFSGNSQYIYAVAFAPDGRTALSGVSSSMPQNGDHVRLWDLATGRELWSASGHSATVTSLAFSPDGKFALSGSCDRTLKLWDAATGRELRSFSGHSADVSAVAFSPDGKRALSGSHDRNLTLWDVATGKALRSFAGHTDLIKAAAFSPDGRHALSAAWDYTLRLWDLATGKTVRTFPGHAAWIGSAAFSPDGRYALSGSNDGTARLWNLADGFWTAFLSPAAAVRKPGDWFIWNADGYWDSSADGGEYVAMVRGLDVWSIDQFAVRNNRPDLIVKHFPSPDPDLMRHYHAQYRKRLRRLEIAEKGPASAYEVPEIEITDAARDGGTLTVRFAIRSATARISGYRVYINNVPVFGPRGKTITGARNPRNVTAQETLELGAGQNKIEISALNEYGAESARALTYAAGAQPDAGPDLYFIGFGVSKYKDSSLDIRYADKDVIDLAEVFQRRSGWRYRRVWINTYINQECTVERIKTIPGLLAAAKPDDVVILFIAGHGMHARDQASAYYFLTHEADLRDLPASAASFELLEEVLQGIKPRNKLFLIDTCESGEIDEHYLAESQALLSDQTRGVRARAIGSDRGLSVAERKGAAKVRTYLFETDRYIYNDVTRRSGSIVFSSCRGGELSYESDSLKNGLFTAAVKEALSAGKPADGDGDGVISSDELRRYVSKSVSEKTGGRQNPTVDRDNIHQKIEW